MTTPIKRFMAPGPWITRELRECVQAKDYDALASDLAAAQEALKNHLHLDNHNAIVRQLQERAQRAEALAESNARRLKWKHSQYVKSCEASGLGGVMSYENWIAAIDAAIAGEKK